MKNALILTALLAIIALSSVPVIGESLEPLTVSPGATDRLTGVEVRCPTFSWQAVPGAAGYEVVVYELPPEVELAAWSLDEAVEVLFVELPVGVTAWTPSLENGLARGADHVWFVRGVFGDGGADGTSWSQARFFRVVGGSSSGTGTGTAAVPATAVATATATVPAADPVTATVPSTMADKVGETKTKDVSTAMAAIRGEMPDVTGETYGVVDTSNSPDGAGLGAVNTAGGPDLVLDGVEDGESDTLVSQDGIRRSSAGVETFTFENTGGGDMHLGVIGTIHGNGSGLLDVDAETLNGHDSSAFSPLTHFHDDRYYTEGELNASGGGGSVHWDNLGAVPADIADGDDDTTYTAGPGLILSGTEFRTSAADAALTPSDHSLSILDDTGTFDIHLATTIGSDGLALVAYFDNSPAKLKVAHCENQACTMVSTSILDNSGNVIRRNSATVGADGLGLVAYAVFTLGKLKVAHCRDVACSLATLVAVADDPVDVEAVIGVDGLPLMSYYQETAPFEGTVNVLRCSNEFCVPYFRRR